MFRSRFAAPVQIAAARIIHTNSSLQQGIQGRNFPCAAVIRVSSSRRREKFIIVKCSGDQVSAGQTTIPDLFVPPSLFLHPGHLSCLRTLHMLPLAEDSSAWSMSNLAWRRSNKAPNDARCQWGGGWGRWRKRWRQGHHVLAYSNMLLQKDMFLSRFYSWMLLLTMVMIISSVSLILDISHLHCTFHLQGSWSNELILTTSL